MRKVKRYTKQLTKVCEEERKKFVIARSLKLYKFQDPISAKNMAANFLNCYSSMLKRTKFTCRHTYETVHNCLKYNKSNSSAFPEIFIDQLENFINC